MGKIDYSRSSRSDFDKSTEREVHNRVSTYNLNESESSKVWNLVQDRNKALVTANKDYKENFQDYVKAEYDRLRAERTNSPKLQLGRNYSSNKQLYHLASENVRLNYLEKEKNLYKATNKEIDRVLENARENGRGPAPQLKRDFENARDHKGR